MPEMDDIYRNHADRYDALVRAEDYTNNLGALLHEVLDWTDASVLEAGVGTGRVTRLYIEQAASSVCCDRSQHMLDYARRALAPYGHKLTFRNAENTDLPTLDRARDVFVEGWSFGHAATACSEVGALRHVTEVLLYNATKNLQPGGTVVIIETLGTHTETPGPPCEKLKRFYDELERRHGFDARVIRTDYRFQTNQEAARILGFFFGDRMKERVVEHGAPTIPEWTGVWTRRIG